MATLQFERRRRIRLALMAALLILLPFAGFVWAIDGHRVFALVQAAVCLILVLAIESLVGLTEREAKEYLLKLGADAAEFEQWKEKVRELDRIVAIMSQENAEFRLAALDSKLHEIAPEAAKATDATAS